MATARIIRLPVKKRFRKARTKGNRPNPRVKVVDADEYYGARMAIYQANLLQSAILKQYRTERGVTQADVAECYGVSAVSVCLWEKGLVAWNADRIHQFKAACNEAVELYVWED